MPFVKAPLERVKGVEDNTLTKNNPGQELIKEKLLVTFTHDASGVKSTEVSLEQLYSKELQSVTFTHDVSGVRSTVVRPEQPDSK